MNDHIKSNYCVCPKKKIFFEKKFFFSIFQKLKPVFLQDGGLRRTSSHLINNKPTLELILR